MTDEGVLDAFAADYLAANLYLSAPMEQLVPEVLELGRSPVGAPPTREIASVTDEVADGVPIRIYQGDGPPTGLVVYFHGGGFVIGSIGLMDNVAREIAHGSGAVVVSVEYRLAPEHPYPAALDDCETVTRWALANAGRFGLSPASVAIAGESAGGNLSAGLALRLREAGDVSVAGQVLIYPAVAGSLGTFPSREAFDGVVLTRGTTTLYWQAYCGGQNLDEDPFAAPLWAHSLKGCPPPWSCSAAATSCATRAAPTPNGCTTRASMWRSSPTPASRTASSTSASRPPPRRLPSSATGSGRGWRRRARAAAEPGWWSAGAGHVPPLTGRASGGVCCGGTRPHRRTARDARSTEGCAWRRSPWLRS